MKEKHKIAYMKTAFVFAQLSTSNRLQVGAVAVKNNRIISCGYNAMPAHIDDPMELPDGNSDPRVRHAEVNCINGLRTSNESMEGASFFCTHWCCLQCAIELVDCKIKEFYYVDEYRSKDGLEYIKKYIPVYRMDKSLIC
jgi:dCMP deaminase